MVGPVTKAAVRSCNNRRRLEAQSASVIGPIAGRAAPADQRVTMWLARLPGAARLFPTARHPQRAYGRPYRSATPRQHIDHPVSGVHQCGQKCAPASGLAARILIIPGPYGPSAHDQRGGRDHCCQPTQRGASRDRITSQVTACRCYRSKSPGKGGAGQTPKRLANNPAYVRYVSPALSGFSLMAVHL
jgi:hypothetical protein